MGNCCSGESEEKKASAFTTSNKDSEAFQIAEQLSAGGLPSSGLGGDFDSSSGLAPSSSASALQQDATNALHNSNSNNYQGGANSTIPNNINNEAQLKAMREEQNRLEVIVQMAGRGMVSVRSTRGSTGYYDQGFAAALGQHLEQTTTFPDHLPVRLPPANNDHSNHNNSSSSSGGDNAGGTSSASSSKPTAVFQRLSQPQWENIALGNKGAGLAGCGGENPNTYMDHVAVSFLDEVVPKKERIFHGGVGPMVENLL